MSKPKNVLVPTDFSPNSAQAVQYACDVARESKANLHLVHVGKATADASAKERTLNQISASIDADSELALTTHKTVLLGSPAKAITDYARSHDVDLIVMGTHGRTGWAHLSMGSVAESVLRDSPCPVTVLGPHDGENTTVTDAMGVISDLIGDGMQKSKDEGHAAMAKALIAHLRVPSTTAILMVDDLEHRNWIEWKDGTWTAVAGEDLTDTVEPFEVNMQPESQAVDLIKRAYKLRATDIHIDPLWDNEFRIRFRIDGQIHEYCRLDHSVGEHMINQYKSMARLDLADPFHAHEGRVSLPNSLRGIEVRFSSAPVAEGQAAALRLLDPQKVMRPLSELGLSTEDLGNVESMLQAGEGLVLSTGPTGSGKTTTVYSMLESISQSPRNIVSIEDPVELTVPFIRQVAVDVKHDLTMSRGLRTLLRMDPDVIFLGEIRDPDTAEISMRAAASGKYVFSTLHTRDVAGTVMALVDLGLNRSSIAANLTGIINQRLVKTLCSRCKEAVPASDAAKAAFTEMNLPEPDVLFESSGCAACLGRGFRGRTGVFETCVVDESLRNSIVQCKDSGELVSVLKERGLRSLRVDALSKASEGLISLKAANSVRWANQI
ncbi:ATPase, T2SS/T4P/T4SS family [Mariniblastus fucicola]|nr:ATPase, T2SS/T4P/T4SS family [Mariniblastus fucicola]